MSAFRVVAWSSALLVLLCAPHVQGQVQPAPPRGTRVRVMTESSLRPMVATVRGLRGEVLLLGVADQSEVAVPLSSIRQLDVSRGRKSKAVTGAATGLLAGTAATALFLSVFCSDPDTACQTDEFVRAFSIIALPSTALGMAIGLAIRVERWETIPLGNDHAGTAYWTLTLPFGF